MHTVHTARTYGLQCVAVERKNQFTPNILFAAVVVTMCNLCSFVQREPQRWTRISKPHFNKLMRENEDVIKNCTEWADVQRHEMCTDPSHGKPVTWAACGRTKRHINNMIVVMHPDMKEELPAHFTKYQFEGKSIPTVGGTFSVDDEYRQEHRSNANTRFAGTGVSSLHIAFTQQEKHEVKSFMARVVCDARKHRRPEDGYLEGRTGVRLVRSDLNRLKLSVVLSKEVIDRVMFYFGVPSDSLKLYESVVLCTAPGSAAQDTHADVSLGDAGAPKWHITAPELQVNLMRLAVVVMVTLDGDITTEVYPSTRSDATFTESMVDNTKRDIYPVPNGDNCILFDARMAHRGVAYGGREESHRLAFVFHHPHATKEQLRVMEICLGKKSQKINVLRLLTDREEEVKMPAVKRSRRLMEAASAGQSRDDLIKLPSSL